MRRWQHGYSRSRNGKLRWAKRLGQLAQMRAAKERKRLENSVERIERPEVGRLLHTLRVTNHVSGSSFEVKVRQGRRLNQIVAETFGRLSKAHGTDWLMTNLRKRLVMRWMT